MSEVFTEDGRIVTVELPVLLGCVDDETNGWGFVLDSDNQAVAEDGNWTQVYGERSCLPVEIIVKKERKDLEGLIDKIYKEAKQKIKNEQYALASRNLIWDKIQWIAAMGFGSAVLLFGLMWLKGG